MSIDVVVVTHQSAATLEACLSAIPPGVNVIVIDNASADDTIGVAAKLAATVVTNTANRGFAAAANQGARLGVGELILFLNPDAVIEARDLDQLRQAIENADDLAVAGPLLTVPGGGEQRPAWPFPSPRRSWMEAFGLHRVGLDDMPDDFVVGACFLVRRKAFEAVGGFDESYWLYGEEADLCARLRDAGWRSQVVPAATAAHVGGASGAASAGVVFEHFNRGTERFIEQRRGRRGLLSHRLALLVGSLLRIPLLALLPGRRTELATRTQIVRRILRVRTRPVERLPEPEGQQGQARGPGADLVVCSLESWDDVWRRNQFLVRELLAAEPTRRVLFVEPPVDILNDLRRGRRPRLLHMRRVTADPRVTLLTPVKVLPRLVNPSADRRLAGRVRSSARALGFTSPTLWVNDSVYAELAARTRWPCVYDITDDWLEADATPRELRRRRSREDRLLAEADEVVVCSEGLATSRGPTRNVTLIPNAVDSERFRGEFPRPADLPPGPVAIYVGTLHEDRLDLGLIEMLADRAPQIRIVLVGPNALTAAATTRLTQVRSVSLLGAKPHDAVPAYYQHADVVIVPHVVSPFTASLDPIKRYECLAAGRPTVATPVAGFVGLPEPIRTAAGSEFVDAVVQAVAAGPTDSLPTPSPTWAERARAFDTVLRRASTNRRKPLRVLFVDHCAELSGGELALVRLIDALDGIDAHVLLAQPGPLVARLEAAGATVSVVAMREDTRSLGRERVGRRLPLRALADSARYTLVVARFIRRLRPDIVHTNSLKAGLYGSLAGRLARIPVVWHVRDRIARDYLPPFAVRLVRLMIATLPTAVIANSNATAATLGMFRPLKRVDVVDSPVSVVHDSAGAIRSAPRSMSATFTVGMVGRIAPWKGQDVFLRAFADLAQHTDAWAIVVGSAMFGEDAFEQEVKNLAARLGIAARVTFAGFVDDLSTIWPTLDVVVHASTIPEPFGQVVVEAMAAGVPVVAADAGGPAEIITNGVDGLLYPMGDARSLADCLARLSEDPGLGTALCEAALVRAEHFSPERVARATMTIYDSVLAR